MILRLNIISRKNNYSEYFIINSFSSPEALINLIFNLCSIGLFCPEFDGLVEG